ncbi:MAG: hypothetical protein FJW37_15580 [Acidobacteria bacterium]|nr:hypothetical protein [Acidobacteriota bacterium]
MQDYSKELERGREIAREAGRIALRHQQRGIGFESKPDASPVTEADRECERFIAAALAEAFPDDGLLGEEGAARESRSGRRWIIDPIDGTRDFVRGNPNWAVLIGLESEGEVAAGFAHFPARDELYWAAAGAGAYRNGARMRVSSIDQRPNAVLCVNGFSTVLAQPFAGGLLEWLAGFWAVRSLGGCLDAMMLAQGQADLWLESCAQPWDLAALKVIAEEAGAVFFDLAGRRTIYGGSCVIAAPGLEREARRFLCAERGAR